MTESETEDYARQMVALLRRLTEVDGDVSVLEKRWVRALLHELPGGDDEAAASSQEFDPQRLKEYVTEEGEAEELIELLLLVSLADGETSPAEWQLITEMARLVGVEAQRLEELRRSTVLTVEPG